MNLLSQKGLSQVKFPGIIKHEHIYNDYHERVANPGYSRNYQGKFFTKWLKFTFLTFLYIIYSLSILYLILILIIKKAWSSAKINI